MPIGALAWWMLWDGVVGDVVVPVAAPRGVPTMLWVNDCPIERYGLQLQLTSGRLSGGSRVLPSTVRFPGLTGGLYEHQRVTEPNDIELTAVILDVPLEQQAQVLALYTDLFTGELELRWPHAPRRIQYAVASGVQAEAYVPEREFVRPDRTCLRVRVTLRAPDTARYDRDVHVLRLSTVPTPIPLGDLPVGGRFTIEGPHSGSLDIDILSPSGVLLHRLALRDAPTLPFTLATNDVLEITNEPPYALIKRTAAGVESNVYRWRSLALSTGWWHVSPAQCAPTRQQWCFVRLSTGAGWYAYRNAYAH